MAFADWSTTCAFLRGPPAWDAERFRFILAGRHGCDSDCVRDLDSARDGEVAEDRAWLGGCCCVGWPEGEGTPVTRDFQEELDAPILGEQVWASRASSETLRDASSLSLAREPVKGSVT